MSDYTEVIILCEDKQSEVFARAFLIEYLNVNSRRIRRSMRAAGQGSGEQYVREQYVTEVKAYRRYSKMKKIALVVMIDADADDVTNRFNQLDQALLSAGESTRQKDEKIAIIMPERNIETWIYYLRGDTVNETDRYKHLETESACKEDVKNLAKNCRNRHPLPADAPSSIQESCLEIMKTRER